jgi:hypothetical protein
MDSSSDANGQVGQWRLREGMLVVGACRSVPAWGRPGTSRDSV